MLLRVLCQTFKCAPGRRAPKATLTREGRRPKLKFISTENDDEYKIETTHIKSRKVGSLNFHLLQILKMGTVF
jgi:hypothetical protein